jgi:hypothetical protein
MQSDSDEEPVVTLDELLPTLRALVRAVPTLQLDTYMDFATLTVARDDNIRHASIHDRELGDQIRDSLEVLIAERITLYVRECARKNTVNFYDYLECSGKGRRRSSIFVHQSDVLPGVTLCEKVAE